MHAHTSIPQPSEAHVLMSRRSVMVMTMSPSASISRNASCTARICRPPPSVPTRTMHCCATRIRPTYPHHTHSHGVRTGPTPRCRTSHRRAICAPTRKRLSVTHQGWWCIHTHTHTHTHTIHVRVCAYVHLYRVCVYVHLYLVRGGGAGGRRRVAHGAGERKEERLLVLGCE